MGAGVVKNVFLAEAQNGIHDVYIRHKGTENVLSWLICASRGTQMVNELKEAEIVLFRKTSQTKTN